MRMLSLGCLLTLAAGLAAVAQDAPALDPLLKILVENKVITLEQAQAVQAEYAKQKAQDTTVIKEDVKNQVSADLKKSGPKLPSALEGLKIGGLCLHLLSERRKVLGRPGSDDAVQPVRAQAGLHRHSEGHHALLHGPRSRRM